VISPYKASGTEMARLALHRQLSGVVDVDFQYRMEEIEVGGSSEALGKTVADIRGGSMIVGLRRGAEFEPQPPGDTALFAGDVIVAIGTPRTLERLEALTGERGG
jgi:voltage-gated potassium channel